jgi:DNA (cytosine-5)-methyltransferase 1
MPDFYEFFAGGGMARAGLGDGWNCTFANDFSPMKAAVYRSNWGGEHLRQGDVGNLGLNDLPGRPSLVWASTPCQDLSLAGNAVGLGDGCDVVTRSGAFWPWANLIRGLVAAGRKPAVLVFENVVGALSSNDGKDFEIVARTFCEAGYAFGAVQIDAKMFLPQSRPRLFVVGVDRDLAMPSLVRMVGPQPTWHTMAIQSAYDRLPNDVRDRWVWWGLPHPLVRRPELASLIEEIPTGTDWHTPETTRKLLAAMSPANIDKLKQAQAVGKRMVGTIYKRTRPHNLVGAGANKRIVRAEVRFDGIAGCLRTPSGGSSRQTVIVVHGEEIRTRLLSTREAARLMGLPDSYKLPENYNDAYHIAGDGVAVPVVRFLAQHLLEPLAAAPRRLHSGRAVA